MRWDPKRPETILEESFLDQVAAGREGERDPGRLPRLPDQPDLAHLVPDRDRELRRLPDQARDGLPGRARLRRRQRAEPASVPAAAVLARRARARGARLRRAARPLLRRAEGGRPGDPGDRPRPLRPRQRPAAGAVERLHLAGPLPPRPRRRLPRERPDAAADGRARPPPLPALGPRPGRAGDRWPRAGIVNLARIKQAFWDAFAGTGQPTVEQGLKLRIDEIGWQAAVPAGRRAAYHGRETAAATSERAQADNYAKLIGIAACDRSISAVYLLHLRDDPDLERYQSGVRRADGSARPAYAAVRDAVARAKRGCAGTHVAWHHATRVVGARAEFGLGAGLASKLRKSWGFNVTAAEEVSYVAAIFPATATAQVRSLASPRAPGAVTMTAGRVRAGWNPRLRFTSRFLPPGRYVYAVRLRASMNPAPEHRARQPVVRRPLAAGCRSRSRREPRRAGPARPVGARSCA